MVDNIAVMQKFCIMANCGAALMIFGQIELMNGNVLWDGVQK